MREQLKALYLEYMKALVIMGKHYHETDVEFYKLFGFMPDY